MISGHQGFKTAFVNCIMFVAADRLIDKVVYQMKCVLLSYNDAP